MNTDFTVLLTVMTLNLAKGSKNVMIFITVELTYNISRFVFPIQKYYYSNGNFKDGDQHRAKCLNHILLTSSSDNNALSSTVAL